MKIDESDDFECCKVVVVVFVVVKIVDIYWLCNYIVYEICGC